MSWEKSEIMREYFKIINAENPAPNPHQEDLKTIEEKNFHEPEKDIIEEAHPDSIYIAESRGDGGLVENQNEQHEKLVHIINKMPTGNLTGRYASAIKDLCVLANQCDAVGLVKEADIITDVVRKMVDNLDVEHSAPFE